MCAVVPVRELNTRGCGGGRAVVGLARLVCEPDQVGWIWSEIGGSEAILKDNSEVLYRFIDLG